MVKISPELVTGTEQGESSNRITTFDLWTGMFRDGISSIPGETVIPLWLGRHFLVVRTGYTTRRWGWLLGRIGYSITHHCPFDSLSWNNINEHTCSCVCLYQLGKAQDKFRAFTLPNSFGATNQPAMACGRTDILLGSAASVFRVGKHVLTVVWFYWRKWKRDWSFLEGKWRNIFWFTVRAVSMYFPA